MWCALSSISFCHHTTAARLALQSRGPWYPIRRLRTRRGISNPFPRMLRNNLQILPKGGICNPFAFCSRCRGMRVGWNSRYIVHCFTCKDWLSKSYKLLILTDLLTVLRFLRFLIAGPFVFSDDARPATGRQTRRGLLEDFDAAIAESVVQPLGDFLRAVQALTRPAGSRRAIIAAAEEAQSGSAADREHHDRREPGESIRDLRSGFRRHHADSPADMGETAEKESINLFKIEDKSISASGSSRTTCRQFGLWEGVALQRLDSGRSLTLWSTSRRARIRRQKSKANFTKPEAIPCLNCPASFHNISQTR